MTLLIAFSISRDASSIKLNAERFSHAEALMHNTESLKNGQCNQPHMLDAGCKLVDMIARQRFDMLMAGGHRFEKKTPK